MLQVRVNGHHLVTSDQHVRASEQFELFLELADQLSVRILVDDGLVLDLLCLVGIPKGAQRLLVICRRDCGNHRRL